MSNSLEKQSDVSDTDIEYTPERITLSDDSVPEPYELSQFDLDIVDDALQNPHSSEFCDHFGFTIQVQTDDEATSSSESEGEDDDQNSISDATRLDQPDSSVQDYRRHDNPGPPEKKYPKKKPAVLRTDTHSSDDEDSDDSIDTAMTTPTTTKTQRLSAKSNPDVVIQAPMTAEQKDINTQHIQTYNTLVGRRGRSGTVSMTTQPTIQMPPSIPSSTFTPSLTPSQNTLPVIGAVVPVTPDETPSELFQPHKESSMPVFGVLGDPPSSDSLQPKKSGLHIRSHSAQPSIPKPEESMGLKRASSLTNSIRSAKSAGSGRTSINIERPSQVYQERQSKRLSEIYKTAVEASPAAPSYYDMLKAKFGKPTQENVHPRETPRQIALKEETASSLKSLKDTNNDYDWEFWASVISGFDEMVKSDVQNLRLHLAVGIPPSLRGMMWQIFSKSRDSNELECEYRELLKRTSPHEKIIRRDLARTFPTHPFFQEKDGEGQQMLFNVIKAYSLFDQKVGYCQGLPFVVGCLLLHMPDEAVFCVLVKLMSHYGLRGHFTPQMETLHERLYQFDQLLLQTLPQVHKHLETHGIKPTMYASQWFMTLFSYRCPFELVFRVFDLVFVEGSSILLNFALALMKKNQKTLLNLEFETLLEFFSNRIFDVYQDEPAAFVHDAYGFNITARQLEKISKKYAVESAKEAKLHSPEDQLRRQNAELAEKLRRMEHSFNILQDEHQDVAHQLISVKMEMAQMNDENQELRRLLGKYRSDPNFAEAAPVKTDGSDMFNRLAQKNAHLVNRNSQLEDRLLEVEATLVDYKMKYAQSESENEMMKQKWQAIQKNNRHS